MRAFSRTYFDSMKDAAEHAEKQRDLVTLKKQAHQDLIRKCKWSKGKKFRAPSVGGQYVNVQCKQQASNECAFSEENITKRIAPNIDWGKIDALPIFEEKVAELYAQIQNARRTYKPLIDLDVRPRKRKQYEVNDDGEVVQQTLKYWRLKQQYSDSLKRSAAFKHKELMQQAMQEMIARGKKLKKIIDSKTNTAFMFQLRHHDEAKPPSAKLLKGIVAELLSDGSVPHNIQFFKRMQVLVENRAERKTWDELVVETEEAYKAKQKKKRQAFEHHHQGFPRAADFVAADQRTTASSSSAPPRPTPNRRTTPSAILRSIGRTIGIGRQ